MSLGFVLSREVASYCKERVSTGPALVLVVDMKLTLNLQCSIKYQNCTRNCELTMCVVVEYGQDLKRAFEQESYHTGRPRLMLTAAVPAGKSNIDAGFDIPNVVRSLDFVNIMTYDLHGSWDSSTGHNSPLYSRASENAADATLNMVSLAHNHTGPHF